jgi:hypothetical protein
MEHHTYGQKPGRTNVADPLSRNPAFNSGGGDTLVGSVGGGARGTQVASTSGSRVRSVYCRCLRLRRRCAALTHRSGGTTGGGELPSSDGAGPGVASDSSQGGAGPPGFTI